MYNTPTRASSGQTPIDPELWEKFAIVQAAMTKEEHGHKMYDPETGDADMERPFLLTHAVMVGLAMILVVTVEMACVAKVSTRDALLQDFTANECSSLPKFALTIAIFAWVWFVVISPEQWDVMLTSATGYLYSSVCMLLPRK